MPCARFRFRSIPGNSLHGHRRRIGVRPHGLCLPFLPGPGPSRPATRGVAVGPGVRRDDEPLARMDGSETPGGRSLRSSLALPRPAPHPPVAALPAVAAARSCQVPENLLDSPGGPSTRRSGTRAPAPGAGAGAGRSPAGRKGVARSSARGGLLARGGVAERRVGHARQLQVRRHLHGRERDEADVGIVHLAAGRASRSALRGPGRRHG